MRKALFILLSSLGILSYASVLGPYNVQTDVQYTYTYDNGNYILGGVSWTASGGTVVSTSQNGTEYSAVISFQTTGSQTVTAISIRGGGTLGSKIVNVSGPPVLPGYIASDQVVCANVLPALLTDSVSASGGDGTYAYQWRSRPVGGSWSNISGATSATHQPIAMPKFTPDQQYQRAVTSNGDTEYSNVVTLSLGILSPGSIAGDQSVCENVDPTVLTSAAPASGGVGTITYQWQYSLDGSTAWTDISGATNETYDPPMQTETRWFRRTASSDCNENKLSNSVEVTYIPPPNPGNITGTDSFCAEASLNLTYNGAMSNAIWEKKDSGGNWNTVMDGASPWSASSNLTETIFSDTEYRVTGGSACGIISTAVKTIYVQSTSAGTIQASSGTYFGEDDITLTLTNSGGTVIHWEMSTDEGTTWTTHTTGVSSIDVPALGPERRYRVKVSYANCGEGYTHYYSFDEAAGFLGYIDGPTEVLDSVNTGTLSVISTLVGDYTEWYSSTDGKFWTYLATGNTYDFQNLTTTTLFKAWRYDQGRLYTSAIHTIETVPAITTNTAMYNYVKATSPVVEETVFTNIPTMAVNDRLVSLAFSDGIGRTVQSVSKEVTPLGKDIISFRTFDPGSNISRSYLPYVDTGDNFYEDTEIDQVDFYENEAIDGLENSAYSYAESRREGGLVVEQGAPGADWQLGAHTVSHAYRFNTANEVTKFDPDNITNTGTYDPNTLSFHEITDENGHKVQTFNNARGQTVLKKVEQNTEWASTANVYDDYGRLIYVFPPEAMEYIDDNSGWSIADLRDTEDLIFEYRYDDLGRLTERKVPSKGWEYIIYDPYDRVALTQDAIMRENDQWAFSKVDKMGRTVYSGLFTTTETPTQLQANYDALDYDGTDPYYEERGITLHGYTNTVYPTQNIELHAVLYYDDYDFDRDDTPDYTLDTSHLIGTPTSLENLRFVSTGGKTRILGSNDWLISVSFYDEDGRVIQVQGNNHKNLQVEDIASMQYADFTGELLESKSSIKVGLETTEVEKRYTYDDRKRLVTTEHRLNGGSWKTLSELVYNELGQVHEKNIGNGLQSIDYTRNIRGWLTKINDSGLTDTDGDIFGQELLYNTADAGLGNTAAYNGNISGIVWSSHEEEEINLTERGYSFTYDKADRLIGANHKTYKTSWSDPSDYDLGGVQYTANGNLLALTRSDTTSADDLTYTYTGNRLLSVSDAVSGEAGFKDGNTSGDDYDYDDNGNLTKDLNKGIDAIYYNHLDLPVRMDLASHEDADSLTYTYDAGGSKLSMKVWKGGSVTSTVDYLGGMRYENDTLRSMAHEEGRIVFEDGEIDYQFVLTDYQGNTRRVLSTITEGYTTTENFEEWADNGFANVNPVDYGAANTTAGGGQVARLSAGTTGPMIMLRMDKGDTIDLQVRAYYDQVPSGTGLLNTAFSALFNSWNNAYGTPSGEGGIAGSQDDFSDALDMQTSEMASKSNATDAPRGYLNYIFFDLNMGYVTAGYQQITTAANGGTPETVVINEIISDQAGYLMAYLTNENQEAVNIHFDDFSVTHRKNHLIQAVDYFPFGMEAKTYTRTAADPTKYLYNAGAEKNDYTSYYETFYRNYDASIGRFNGVDIMAPKYHSLSPYIYAQNDPIFYNDPLGDDVVTIILDWDDIPDNSVTTLSFGDSGFSGIAQYSFDQVFHHEMVAYYGDYGWYEYRKNGRNVRRRHRETQYIKEWVLNDEFSNLAPPSTWDWSNNTQDNGTVNIDEAINILNEMTRVFDDELNDAWDAGFNADGSTSEHGFQIVSDLESGEIHSDRYTIGKPGTGSIDIPTTPNPGKDLNGIAHTHPYRTGLTGTAPSHNDINRMRFMSTQAGSFSIIESGSKRYGLVVTDTSKRAAFTVTNQAKIIREWDAIYKRGYKIDAEAASIRATKYILRKYDLGVSFFHTTDSKKSKYEHIEID